jgi:diguanylate cyclase (GGDEF)-like protein
LGLVDALSLKFKLYFLLGLVIFGLLLTGAMGYYNLSKMKKNLDALYFGNFIPVTELNEIQKEYNKEIFISFYKLQNDQLIPSEAAEKINISRQKILKTWASYRSHFKRDYELTYMQYADSEIHKSAEYLNHLSSAIVTLDNERLSQLSSKILLNNISHINEVIHNILNYESEMAQYERKELLSTYDKTLYQLAAILIFLIASAIMIIAPIFQSIQNNQRSLINTSKKLHSVNKKLETASITDSLTELYNRRYFNLIYNRELTRCIREHTSIAFMMLDIDYFKVYNDTYGHLQGDSTLKAVAQVMKDTLQRPGDYIFRLGGEEFGVLIANITEENAYTMAERLRQNVRDLKLEHKNSKASDYVTLSVGVIVLTPDQDIDPEIIIQKADENLYHAKEEGRNQVVISELIEEQEHEQSA